MDKARVGPALGKVCSGLYICTARLDEFPLGMLCSFVEQASLDPPMITVALSTGRRLAQVLEATGKLGINILGEDNRDLMRPFASPGNEDPFRGIVLAENGSGLPQLADAMAFLACELRQQMDAGDHTVYLLEVIDGVLQEDSTQPMTRIRRNGFQY